MERIQKQNQQGSYEIVELICVTESDREPRQNGVPVNNNNGVELDVGICINRR